MGLLVMLLLSAAIFSAAGSIQTKPNIVLIVIDDMGYRNIHAPPVWDNDEIKSPALAKFASEGISLSNFMTYKWCGPSRAAILTGRLPGHGISEQMWGAAEAAGYNANLTMLPAKLKSVGYATHAVGKWHCGFYDRKFLPTSRGFDSYIGYLSGSVDHFTQTTSGTCNSTGHVVGTDLWADGDNAVGLNGTYAAFTYTSTAVALINRHAERQRQRAADRVAAVPLFLYLALQNVHGPDEAPSSYVDAYNSSIYAKRRMKEAMVSVADESIANVTAALAANGMEEDTIVVIFSDNGGPIQEANGQSGTGNNWPLRGGKYALYEGGVRVVSMVKYPALLRHKAGTVYDGLIHSTDWYATLITLAGGDPSDTGVGRVPIDGIDFFNVLAANSSVVASPRKELLLGMGFEEQGSYRNGTSGMKIIVGSIRVGFEWVGPLFPNASSATTVWPRKRECLPYCLYNLTADPAENTNLAGGGDRSSEIGAAMLSRYNELVVELSAPNSDVPHVSHETDDRACETMLSAGGWWRPYVGNPLD